VTDKPFSSFGFMTQNGEALVKSSCCFLSLLPLQRNGAMQAIVEILTRMNLYIWGKKRDLNSNYVRTKTLLKILLIVFICVIMLYQMHV